MFAVVWVALLLLAEVATCFYAINRRVKGDYAFLWTMLAVLMMVLFFGTVAAAMHPECHISNWHIVCPAK